MQKQIDSVREFLLPIIDFFYPPFRRIMNLQTFRYAVCGGSNMAFGYLVYYVTFKFILQENNLHLGFYEFKAHSASLFISFCLSFPVGFLLLKFVVFNDSAIKARVQLFRYLMVCLFNLLLNYIMLKVLVERLHVYPTIAQIFTVGFVVVFSYLAQRHFSFKASPPPVTVSEEEATN